MTSWFTITATTPTLAPSGSTLLTFMLATYNYEYWNKLYKDNKDAYEKEKSPIANELINILKKRFGDIIQNIEMIDVSTPVSFRNFSGNWKGSFEGWLITPEVGLKHLSHTLPGLKNFYMCGQWVAIEADCRGCCFQQGIRRRSFVMRTKKSLT